MTIKNKILSRMGLMILLVAMATIVIVTFHFRNYGIQAAKDKAAIISNLVKDGLTSHMVNGTMDKRDMFLANISHVKDIQNLWVVRGDLVNKQYGPPRPDELPRDAIDRKVLATGQKIEVLNETMDSATLRVTIPYVASANEVPKCISCHEANIGDTLGAISMEFDIMSIRTQGIRTIIYILLTTMVTLAIIIILTNRLLNPYLELFESLLESIKNATKGNFTFNVQTHLKDEAGDVAHWFNSLLGKLHDTFGSIETKLGSFIAHPHRLDDPLAESSNTINELSNIYKFKKAIENDGSKDDIYQRIIYLFEKHFGITNYIIKEVSEDGMVEKIVHTAGEGFCDRISNGSDHDSCRARRTGNIVSSDQFPEICLGYMGSAPYFYCLPISFGGKVRLVANITCADEEEFKRVSKIAPHLENYLSEAAPILESKMLMEKLRESSLRDSLTGLYNRKFLDEYIEKAAAQTLRDKSRLGILMIDIDHFKMVNDTYGHDVGDLVLKTVAKTIRENLRESDLVVRYGGEEMMVILHAVSDEVSMMQVAEKIRLKVAENKIKVGSETLIKTISIGGALFPIQANTIWKAVKYADVALYNAKHSGRNKVVLFDSTMWSGDKY